MQLNQLCSSSGAMLNSDAGLQEPIGFALRIAFNSFALLCELANNGCQRLLRAFG